MKKYYALRILDDEDGFCYETLIYDNLEDYEKARKIVEQVDIYWCSEEFEENEKTCGGFYEYLLSKLKENNLYNHNIYINEIYVR